MLDDEEGCSRCQAQKEINSPHILGAVNNVCKYVNIHISFTLNMAVTKKTVGDGKKLLTYLNSALKALLVFDIFPRVPKISEILLPKFKLRFLSNSPSWSCTLLPASVRLLETFLEVILLKPFQLFRPILKYVSRITKVPSHQCWFQSWEQVQIRCSQVRRVWWMLQGCHMVVC